jgi:hypothetical protein
LQKKVPVRRHPAPPTAIPAIAPLARCVPLAVFLSLVDDELGELPLSELLSEEVPLDVAVTVPEKVNVESPTLVEAPVGTPLDAVTVAAPI